jgi:DNA damage-binding protein 1
VCRTVPLNEQPRRVAHQPATASFGVITLSAAVDKSFVRVYSQSTWEELAAVPLDQNEMGNHISSIPHPDDPTAEVRLQ